MIGTGLFTTSGFLLAELHSPWLVLAAWAVGGVIAALGALNYGALARRIPESGGEYLFLSRTLHPAAGYIAGWISLLVGFSHRSPPRPTVSANTPKPGCPAGRPRRAARRCWCFFVRCTPSPCAAARGCRTSRSF